MVIPNSNPQVLTIINRRETMAANKTDKILEIVLTIIHEPRQMISEEKLKAIVTSDKSDKTFYRWKKKLIEDPLFNGSPPLRLINDGDKTSYALSSDLMIYFVPEHVETIYFLESYRKLGYLFKNEKYDEDIKVYKEDMSLNGKGEEMRRKFYYLSKLKSNEPGESQQDYQAIIVAAVINNHVIALKYRDKLYPRIFPLCLCQYRDSLYLIAYRDNFGSDNIRHFKLNRVQNVIETQEAFKYPNINEWNPETYYENSSGIVGGTTKEAVIKVTGLSREHIFEREFFNGTLLKQTDDVDEYKIVYTAVDEFLGQLFVYAQDIEIVSPNDLKEAFVEKAKSALDKNTPPKKKKVA